MYAGGAPLSALISQRQKFRLQAKNIFAAWSVRQLVKDYNNPLLNARAGNSVTNFVDIGANKNGDFNLNALQVFLNGQSTAYTAKWYDQSGNGFDMTQNDPAAMARIFAGNLPELMNNRQTIYSQNQNVRLAAPPPFANDDEIILCAVLRNDDSYGYNTKGSTALCLHEDPNRISAHLPWVGGEAIFDTGAVNYRLKSAFLTLPQKKAMQITLINSKSRGIKTIRYNGKLIAQSGTYPTMPVTSMTIFGRLPIDQQDASFNGAFSEVVLFKPDIFDFDLLKFERNQCAYFGIQVN